MFRQIGINDSGWDSVSNGKQQHNINTISCKSTDFQRWIEQMNVIFRFQDVGEIVQEGDSPFETNASDLKKTVNKEQMKKDEKALFLIFQCVDPNIFEKNIKEESAKEACGKLKKLYGGDEKLKRNCMVEMIRRKMTNQF